MMFRRILTVFACSALMSACAAEMAFAMAISCGPRGVVVKYLAEKHKETQAHLALARPVNGSALLIEVFTNETTGTWTILQTRPNLRSCIMAAGNDWQAGENAGGKYW